MDAVLDIEIAGLKIGRNKRYWCVLKRQTLLLLDKPPALNTQPQLCLKILVLPSVTVCVPPPPPPPPWSTYRSICCCRSHIL